VRVNYKDDTPAASGSGYGFGLHDGAAGAHNGGYGNVATVQEVLL
jgi:hypothetical protein